MNPRKGRMPFGVHEGGAGGAEAAHGTEAVQDPEPALPKGGTCLLTAGVVSSGKTTLLHALIHRIYTDETVDFAFRDANGDALHDPELQHWIFNYDAGHFPAGRTPVGKLQTFFIEFGQGRRAVKLSFADLSGEDYEGVVPARGSEAAEAVLDDGLEHILTTRDVKKLIIFVADGTRGEKPASTEERDQALFEDMMFFVLLNRIRKLGVRRIRVLFVATKWDRVHERNLSARRFFKRRFPQTRAALRRFHMADVQYIRFSVGEVGKWPDGKDRIVRHDATPISRVVQWIYSHAAGRPLKGYPPMRRGLWSRLKEWVAS